MATAKERMYGRIEKHGRQVLAIFPAARIQDPIKLCKALRRMEREAERACVAYCNGDINEEQIDKTADGILAKVGKLLSTTRVWINRDPRGYLLKIDLQSDEKLHRDMGGYGILTPDMTSD